MNRFALIPYDLYDDLANGEITPSMFQAMLFLYKWADWATGTVRKVRASRMATASGEYGFADRTFQRALKNLHDSGRITSHRVSGSKSWYKIDINNFKALTGALKDTLLRPIDLKNWKASNNDRGADEAGLSSGETGREIYSETGGEMATVLKSSQKSLQTSSQTSEQNSIQEFPSLPSSPSISREKISERKTKPDVEDIAKETLVQLLGKLFETEYQPVHEIQLPAMMRCFSNGTPPAELNQKMLRFADWMIERGFSGKIVSMKDFFHHWENAAGHENGFRPQFEALYRAEKKRAAAGEEAEAIPNSDWDWICRAPACNRPWTQEVKEIKLCDRCAAAFPDHPAEELVRWQGDPWWDEEFVEGTNIRLGRL